MEHVLKCEWCRQKFTTTRLKGSNGKPRRFCSQHCAMKWRHAQPDYIHPASDPKVRAASSKRMKELRERPDVKRKLNRYLRSDRNPFKDPSREFIENRKKATSYDHLVGGNGTGLTKSQKLLLDLLGANWKPEFVIPTKKKSGFPNHYKIDLARPRKKIAVEIDGISHATKKVRAADKRKDQFLRDEGWTVIRVSNQQVLEHPLRTAKMIKKMCQSTT